jgi:hypothetical protein
MRGMGKAIRLESCDCAIALARPPLAPSSAGTVNTFSYPPQHPPITLTMPLILAEELDTVTVHKIQEWEQHSPGGTRMYVSKALESLNSLRAEP